jgi:hypothetical protein
MSVVGRTYLERGRPVVVLTAWVQAAGRVTSASDGKTARSRATVARTPPAEDEAGR